MIRLLIGALLLVTGTIASCTGSLCDDTHLMNLGLIQMFWSAVLILWSLTIPAYRRIK